MFALPDAEATVPQGSPGLAEQFVEKLNDPPRSVVGEAVVDRLPVSPGGHQPFLAQPRELLGDGSLSRTKAVLE